MDSQVAQLGQINWLPGRPFPEPAHLMRAAAALYGTPYHNPAFAMRSTQLIAYSAPFAPKHNPAYAIGKPTTQSIGNAQAAAPATGIYTGVPNNGCGGGNPYS